MSGMSGMSRTGRGRGRARAEIVVARVQIQTGLAASGGGGIPVFPPPPPAGTAAGQAKAGAARLAKPPEALGRLVRPAGTRFRPTPDAVAARVTAIAAQRRVKAYLRPTIPRAPAGKPVLSWHFDQAAIDAEAAAAGWYALTANLEPAQAGPD